MKTSTPTASHSRLQTVSSTPEAFSMPQSLPQLPMTPPSAKIESATEDGSSGERRAGTY